eukprot:COSAG02_NODE_17456_length_1002_cov_0.880399_2_plen_36_part_00
MVEIVNDQQKVAAMPEDNMLCMGGGGGLRVHAAMS